MSDPISFIIATGVLTNFVYDALKKNASEGLKAIAPGFFRGSNQLLREMDNEFEEIKEKTLNEFSAKTKTVEIFLSDEKTIRDGVLNPLFEHLFLNSRLDRQALIANFLSCRADGEVLGSKQVADIVDFMIDTCKSVYLANAKTAPYVIYSGVQEVKQAFVSVNEVNNRLLDQFQRFESDQDNDIALFCSDYLAYIKGYVREIIINGLDAVTKKENVRHLINDAFVPLTIDHAVSYRTALSESVGVPWRGNAFDLVKSIPRIIIRGPAGSGKTTLLQWFISKCEPFDNVKPPNSLDIFPIYVPLRRLEALHLDDWSIKNVVFSTLTGEELRRRFPTSLFTYMKEKHFRYTFLLDGVDELSEPYRDRFWQFVESIVKLDATARIIITSRNLSVAHLSTGEYRDDIYQSQASFRAAAYQWRPPLGFLEFVVLPLTNEEIVQFIEQWHLGLDEQLLPASNREELSKFSKNLRGALFVPDNRSALELCRTPILCALICLTFFLGGGRLPKSKRSLYEIATRLLVETRDEYRRIKLPRKFDALTGVKRIELLRRVALLMQEGLDPDLFDQSLEIDKAKLVEFVAGWMGDVGFQGLDPEEVITFLIDRCSIIREPVNNRIDFIHRSFMEYLAANEAVVQRNPHAIRIWISQDQWQSTLQFMMDTPTGGVFFAGQLIADMIKYVDELPKKKIRGLTKRALYLRIASLLSSMPEVPNSFQDYIATLAKSVLPPVGRSEIIDCLGIPFQFLREPLDFETVKSHGSEVISLSGELLARHEDSRCADILRTGYVNVADQELIYLINRAGRIPPVEHSALIARVLNGSYKKKVFVQAKEINNRETHKLINRDVGVRFPIDSTDLRGWSSLKKCFDVTFIGANLADWDKLRKEGCTFDACSGLELEDCSEFDLDAVAKMFPKIEYTILDNCERVSLNGLENCKDLELIEFRNMFSPIELNKWPKRLQEVILVNCGQQSLATLEAAGIKVTKERSAVVFHK